jgi:hypothetical protein
LARWRFGGRVVHTLVHNSSFNGEEFPAKADLRDHECVFPAESLDAPGVELAAHLPAPIIRKPANHVDIAG